MKVLFSLLFLMLSFSSYADHPQSMICSDTEFGAGHLRLIVSDMRGFYSPRDQKPLINGDFWIKGEKFKGMIEGPSFMPEWGQNAGTFTASPAMMDLSFCKYDKCPVRKIKLSVHTSNNVTGEGTLKFVLQVERNKKENFSANINCEFK